MRTEARETVAVRSFPRSRIAVFALIAVGGLVWDLYSKSAVFADLGYPAGSVQPSEPGRHVLFPHPNRVEGQSTQFLDGWVRFRLYTSFNEGALWGMGQGYTWLFAALSVVAVIFVLYWLFGRGAARSLWLTVALALIMAGTLGNLYDRMGLHGCTKPGTDDTWYAVRDFLLFEFGGWPWPVFNFADVFLVTGASMLVLQSLQAEPARAESTARSSAAA